VSGGTQQRRTRNRAAHRGDSITNVEFKIRTEEGQKKDLRDRNKDKEGHGGENKDIEGHGGKNKDMERIIRTDDRRTLKLQTQCLIKKDRTRTLKEKQGHGKKNKDIEGHGRKNEDIEGH
jgi:hypothetical protein